MFNVIQLFVIVFVFGRIVQRTIRIRPNSLKPLFGTSLKYSVVGCAIGVVWFGVSGLWTKVGSCGPLYTQ